MYRPARAFQIPEIWNLKRSKFELRGQRYMYEHDFFKARRLAETCVAAAETCELHQAEIPTCAEISCRFQPAPKSKNFDAGHFGMCMKIPKCPHFATEAKTLAEYASFLADHPTSFPSLLALREREEVNDSLYMI